MAWRKRQRWIFNQAALIAEWLSYEKNDLGHNRNFGAPGDRGNLLSLGDRDDGLAVCISLSVFERTAARWSAGRVTADTESGRHPGRWSAGRYSSQPGGDALPQPNPQPGRIGGDPFQTAFLLIPGLECIDDRFVA